MNSLSLLTKYKKIILQFLLLLFIYQCSRLLFYVINRSYFQDISAGSYIKLAFHSLRFDISTVFSINLPYLFFTLLPFTFASNNKIYCWFLNTLFILSNVLAFTFDLADIGYFPYVRKRMSADVFKLIGKKSDFIDLLPSYLHEFWYVPIALICLIVLFVFINYRISNKYKHAVPFSLLSVFVYLITLGISIVAIRGGLQLKPILNNTALLVVENKHTALVLNTPFSILHTFEEKKLKQVHYFSEKEILETFNPIKNYHKETPTNKFNIAVIILESFGKQYTSLGGRTSYTPFLDSLMHKSLVCTNAFANAFRSADGIPACIAGLPSFMDEPFTTSPYADNAIETLPNLLQKIGYTSSFYHGGTNGTMSFDIFSKNAGFDKYAGRTEYGNDEDYDGTWGIWDEPYLQYFANELDKEKQPFLSSIFTLSSHEPFHLPDSYKNTKLASKKGIERGIRYTDMALRKFFETASTKSWFQNTLFVITADHNFMANNDSAGYYNTGLGLYSIPIIFYQPTDKNLVGFHKDAVQQIDILPTVMDYLHYPNNFFAYGNSILNKTEKHFVYNQMQDHRQFLFNNYALISDNMFADGLYYFTKDSLLRKRIYNDSLQRTIEMPFKKFQQLLQNTIINNQQTVESFQNK